MIPQSPPPTLCRVLSRIIFAAAVLLSLSTAVFAGQSEASGSKAVGSNLRKHCGKLSETEVAQNLTSQSTNSTSFVNVIGSGVSFIQGGTSAGCDEHLNPLPWLVLGLALVVGGIAAHRLHDRRRH